MSGLGPQGLGLINGFRGSLLAAKAGTAIGSGFP